MTQDFQDLHIVWFNNLKLKWEVRHQFNFNNTLIQNRDNLKLNCSDIGDVQSNHLYYNILKNWLYIVPVKLLCESTPVITPDGCTLDKHFLSSLFTNKNLQHKQWKQQKIQILQKWDRDKTGALNLFSSSLVINLNIKQITCGKTVRLRNKNTIQLIINFILKGHLSLL